MLQWLAIAAGGAVGAMARYGMHLAMVQSFGRDFPYATLIINVIGSFLIGVFAVVIMERMQLPEVWRLGLVVGLLGAFTTFSTFSLESLFLLHEGAYLKALTYVLSSVILCIAAAAAGVFLARL